MNTNNKKDYKEYVAIEKSLYEEFFRILDNAKILLEMIQGNASIVAKIKNELACIKHSKSKGAR